MAEDMPPVVLRASAVVVDGVEPLHGAPMYCVVVEDWPRPGERREVRTSHAFGTHRLRARDATEIDAQVEITHRTPAYTSWAAYLLSLETQTRSDDSDDSDDE
jgi:hypothetical protein